MTDMVNRVNGNDYYDYTKLKMPDAADKTGSDDAFSLAYQRAQKESDEKDKEEKDEELSAAEAGRQQQRTVMQSGVKLELSGSGQAYAEANRSDARKPDSVGQSLVDTVRTWITSFIQSVKDILYKIWYDPVPSENIVTEKEIEEAGEPERLSEEYLALKNLEGLQDPETVARQHMESQAKRDEEIQKLLRSGDMERVVNLVTENGQKSMAKNSTLLTYYDRSGKIAPLSASDQERILHGDRNVKKL